MQAEGELDRDRVSATPSADRRSRAPAPPGRACGRTSTGWAFALPFVAIFVVFLLVPILASFVLSFTSFGIGNIQDWYERASSSASTTTRSCSTTRRS